MENKPIDKVLVYYKIVSTAIAIYFTMLLFLIIHPHSSYIDLLWLVGAALSPGNTSSISGWYVFIMVTFTLISKTQFWNVT